VSDRDVRELVARVGKLERDNRRLKLAGAGVVAVLLAVALVGAVLPQEIPEVIEAREFRVVDENGDHRARSVDFGVSVEGDNGFVALGLAGLVFADNDQNIRAQMDDTSVQYFDDKGTRRAAMSGAGVVSRDQTGTARAQVNENGLFLNDPAGELRASLFLDRQGTRASLILS